MKPLAAPVAPCDLPRALRDSLVERLSPKASPAFGIAAIPMLWAGIATWLGPSKKQIAIFSDARASKMSRLCLEQINEGVYRAQFMEYKHFIGRLCSCLKNPIAGSGEKWSVADPKPIFKVLGLQPRCRVSGVLDPPSIHSAAVPARKKRMKVVSEVGVRSSSTFCGDSATLVEIL